MNKIISSLLLIFVLSSCHHYEVYLLESMNTMQKDPTYIIHHNKKSFEIYRSPYLHYDFYEMIEEYGKTEDSLISLGYKKTEEEKHYYYQIDYDSTKISYIHRRIESNPSSYDTVNIPLLNNSWFEVKPFVLLNYTSGHGVSCGLKERSWDTLYGRRIEDTICLFNSSSARTAYRFEFFSCNPEKLNDSTNLEDPIIILIDIQSGIPMSLQYKVTFGGVNDIESIGRTRCVDHRSFWVTRKRLFEFLW